MSSAPPGFGLRKHPCNSRGEPINRPVRAYPAAGADFLSKAIACTLKPNTLEGAPDELADFAAQMGFTPGDFSEALSPHIRQSLEQAFSKTGDITVTPGNPTVNVTFNLTSKGRVVRTFQERITWVWHDGEWYLR